MSINCESCAVFEPLSLSSVQFRAVDVVLCSTWSVDMMTWLKRSSWEIRWTCRIWRDVIGNVVTNLMIFRLWTTVQRDVLGMISMWLHMGMTWYMIWPRTTAAYNRVFVHFHFFSLFSQDSKTTCHQRQTKMRCHLSMTMAYFAAQTADIRAKYPPPRPTLLPSSLFPTLSIYMKVSVPSIGIDW